MKYHSLRRPALLAVGAALIALSSPPALHAQASVTYQNGNSNNGSSTKIQSVHVSGPANPAPAPQPITAMHSTGVVEPLAPANTGPVVRYGPVLPPTWSGPGYMPSPYNGQNNYSGPYNGQPAYAAPYQRQTYINPPPADQPIVIPDAVAEPVDAQPGPMATSLPPHTVHVTYQQPVIQTGNGNTGRRHHHDPDFLGGYYFGNYTQDYDGAGSYQSAYSYYPGVPTYIYEPTGGVVVFAPPVSSPYVGGYIPFDPSDIANYGIENLYRYQQLATTENPFLYHGPAVLPNPYLPPTPPPSQEQQQAPTNQGQDQQPSTDQGQAQQAPAVEQPAPPSYKPGSYKEAFADIESAWINGDMDSIHKHLRDNDLKIAVSLNGKYSYSISSGDWSDITRDALDHLQTVSFQFSVLRFQKNGDITGYAKHVYTAESKDGDKEDTMYLSYTLRHRNNMWYIVSVDTSPKPLIKEQTAQPAATGTDSDSGK